MSHVILWENSVIPTNIDLNQLEIFNYGPQIGVLGKDDKHLHFLECLLSKNKKRLLENYDYFVTCKKTELLKELASWIRGAMFLNMHSSLNWEELTQKYDIDAFAAQEATKVFDLIPKSDIYNSIINSPEYIRSISSYRSFYNISL
jgi:hypothetical protein